MTCQTNNACCHSDLFTSLTWRLFPYVPGQWDMPLDGGQLPEMRNNMESFARTGTFEAEARNICDLQTE